MCVGATDTNDSTDFFAQDAHCQSVIRRRLHQLDLLLTSTSYLVLSLHFKDKSRQMHLMIHRPLANTQNDS